MTKYLIAAIAVVFLSSPSFATESVIAATDKPVCYNINGDEEPCDSSHVVAQKICVHPLGLRTKCFAVDKLKLTYTSEDGHNCTTNIDRIGANVDTVCKK